MTNKGKKLEPPLKLEIGFDEALARFALTKSQEVEESIKRAKTKRPPQDGPLRRPARVKRETSPPARQGKHDGD